MIGIAVIESSKIESLAMQNAVVLNSVVLNTEIQKAVAAQTISANATTEHCVADQMSFLLPQSRSASRTRMAIACSVFTHLGLFLYCDTNFVEQSSYAVAAGVAGVSLEFLPGAKAAEASNVGVGAPLPSSTAASASQVMDAPKPAALPQALAPRPTTKVSSDFLKKPTLRKASQSAKIKPALESSEQSELATSDRSTINTTSVAQPPTALTSNSGGSESSSAGSDSASASSASAGAGEIARGAPDYLRNPPPIYPRSSRLSGEEGVVVLTVRIDTSGVVLDLTLKRSSQFSRLDQAALESVRDWKFKPARIAGLAVASTVEVPVKFVLR